MPDFPGHSFLKVNAAFSMHKFSDKFSSFSELCLLQLSHFTFKPSGAAGCLPQVAYHFALVSSVLGHLYLQQHLILKIKYVC